MKSNCISQFYLGYYFSLQGITAPQRDALWIASVPCWSFFSSSGEALQTAPLAELLMGKTRDLVRRGAIVLPSFACPTRCSRTELLSASLLPPSSSRYSICSGCVFPGLQKLRFCKLNFLCYFLPISPGSPSDCFAPFRLLQFIICC